MTHNEQKFLKHIERWRALPVEFVRSIFRVEPTKQQAEMANAIAHINAQVSVRSGHGTGKTSGMAMLILWFISVYPSSKCPCTAPTHHQLKDLLWAEIHKWHKRMPPWMQDQIVITSDSVYAKGAQKEQFAVARTARKESASGLQGFHADHLLIVMDEAPGIPDNIYEVLRGAKSGGDVRTLIAGNPHTGTGFFYNSHHKMSHNWTCLQFSCLDSPLSPPSYAQEMADEYGEDSDFYRVRVLGDFPRGSIRQLISSELVRAQMGKGLQRHEYEFAPKVLGVDVAWEGDDSSCIYLRQGLYSKCLGIWHNIDSTVLASLVAQYEDEHKTDSTFVDVGWGTGLIDRLRLIGRHPIPINFGGKSPRPEYSNMRTHMWLGIKSWLEEGGVLDDDDRIYDDLCSPQYNISESTGRQTLETKKDMKARGIKSPDKGDALALTFALPVVKQSIYDGTHVVNTEFKVF